MAHLTFRDRFPVGRLAEIEYLEPAPDNLFISVVIATLYILAVACLLFFWWLGHKLVLYEALLSTGFLGTQPANLAELRVSGAMIGLPPGILSAAILIAIAQGLGLFVRIERNTRHTKELLYHLLIEGQATLPR